MPSMKRAPKCGNGMLKLAAWSLLLLVTALFLWHGSIFLFLDDFFERPALPQTRDRFVDLDFRPASPPTDFRRPGSTTGVPEWELIAEASPAGRAALLRDAGSGGPDRFTPDFDAQLAGTDIAPAATPAFPEAVYAHHYGEPTVRPPRRLREVSEETRDRPRRGRELTEAEMPSLSLLGAATRLQDKIAGKPAEFSGEDSQSQRPIWQDSSTSVLSLPKIRDRAALDALAPMVELTGGSFRMGSDEESPLDRRPCHTVRLSPFRMDVHQVTNRQFRLFVRETGYRTVAERYGWSYVFDFQRKTWVRMAGACWWNPIGTNPGGSSESGLTEAMLNLPAVHLAWDDAVAFCHWAGKRLPTEAEWEYAAKGGLLDAVYPWGQRRRPDERERANYWQGWFPDENSLADGYRLLAPVGSFPANPYGLFDMAGNAWEWCSDRYRADYYHRSALDNPLGPSPEEGETVTVPLRRLREENGRFVEESFEGVDDVPVRVIRGGSFLSAENTDAGYRVSARGRQPQSLSFQDVGFRCVEDARPQ